EKVVVRPEYVAILRGRPQRLVILSQPEPGLHLAGRATGRRDHARGVRRKKLLVHARPLAVVALKARKGCQPEQVPKADRSFGEHRHVRVRAARRYVVGPLRRLSPEHRSLVEATFRGDVRLDTDDRPY